MNLIEREKAPLKGLMMIEWSVVAYLFITLSMILFCYTDLVNPEEMIFGRVRVLLAMALLWAVYKIVPCRLTTALRIGVQGSFLPWWYADTYELNRILPNLDHIFARAEQSIFGCQPSLLFSQVCPWDAFSEALYLGYYSYFYLILLNAVLYFIWRYEDFTKVTAVTLGSFFVYYLVFIFLPVAGPQYYYEAIGMENVVNGIFPDVGNYFLTHQDVIPAPGMDGGIFRSIITSGAVHEGERPTAAFPSSHIGMSTVVAFMLMRLCRLRKDWRPMYVFTPLYTLLCMATVYIHAHYLIDAIAGLVTGTALYFVMWKFVPADRRK